MEVDTLLNQVLADFDLTREEAAGRTQVVVATLRPGRQHPNLRSARLEIDANAKVLRKVVLERTAVTVTLTLAETRPADDARFELESYLAPGAPIHAQDRPPRRPPFGRPPPGRPDPRLDMLRRY